MTSFNFNGPRRTILRSSITERRSIFPESFYYRVRVCVCYG